MGAAQVKLLFGAPTDIAKASVSELGQRRKKTDSGPHERAMDPHLSKQKVQYNYPRARNSTSRNLARRENKGPHVFVATVLMA